MKLQNRISNMQQNYKWGQTEKVSIIKNWLSRDGLQLIATPTQDEQETCNNENNLLNMLNRKFKPQYNKTITSLSNVNILKNRTNIFSVETSFCQFSNMASSGLKKMFILQYYIHKNVYQKMFSQITFSFFLNGRCYAIC